MRVLRRQLLLAGALVWLTGCASIGPPLPPSLELPKPPSDLRAVRKGEKVTLTWSIPVRTADRQRVRYLGKTRICRSFDQKIVDTKSVAADSKNTDPKSTGSTVKQCDTPVGENAPPTNFYSKRKAPVKKVTASFADTLPSAIEQAHPAGFATYAVEVLNEANRSGGISNQVHVPLVPTIPPFSDFRARATAQGVLISWRCPASSGRTTGIKYLFRIYRHSESSPSETRIAELDATDCALGPRGLVPLSGPPANAETSAPKEDEREPVTSFLDQTFEWEQTYFYRGAVVSAIETAGKPAAEVEGDDTPVARVFADDVFPPTVPTGLQAVFSGPGQQAFVDLIWTPVTDADLQGYNIYRHEEGAPVVKLNSEVVRTPAFRDARVGGGKTYFYSVSAIDQRGNESARSEQASERVP
jgi:hypothetical protein